MSVGLGVNVVYAKAELVRNVSLLSSSITGNPPASSRVHYLKVMLGDMDGILAALYRN